MPTRAPSTPAVAAGEGDEGAVPILCWADRAGRGSPQAVERLKRCRVCDLEAPQAKPCRVEDGLSSPGSLGSLSVSV